jgi:hypothetical protein
MNIKCRLGFHDWEYLETDHAEAIEFRLRNPSATIRLEGTVHRLHKRVCLRCHKIEDEISEFTEEAKKEIQIEENRRLEALALSKRDEMRKIAIEKMSKDFGKTVKELEETRKEFIDRTMDEVERVLRDTPLKSPDLRENWLLEEELKKCFEDCSKSKVEKT